MTGEDHLTSEETSALDPEPLQKLRSIQRPNRPSIVVRVVRSYLDDLPSFTTQLHEAVAGGDFKTLHLVAHTWKSSSANVGAMALSDLCSELERVASEGSEGPVSDLVKRIESEFPSVRVALEAELRKEADPANPAG